MQSSLGTYHSSAHPRSPSNPVYHHICELVADTRGCSCSGNVYHRNTYLGLDLSLKTVKSVNAENKTKFSKICDILRKKGHVATVPKNLLGNLKALLRLTACLKVLILLPRAIMEAITL